MGLRLSRTFISLKIGVNFESLQPCLSTKQLVLLKRILWECVVANKGRLGFNRESLKLRGYE